MYKDVNLLGIIQYYMYMYNDVTRFFIHYFTWLLQYMVQMSFMYSYSLTLFFFYYILVWSSIIWYYYFCHYRPNCSLEGSVSINIGLLHASICHYSNDEFAIYISCCFDLDDVGTKIRKIVDLRNPSNNQVHLHKVFNLSICEIE